MSTLRELALKAAQLKEQINQLSEAKREIEDQIKQLPEYIQSANNERTGTRELAPGIAFTVNEKRTWDADKVIPLIGEIAATGAEPFTMVLKETRKETAKLAQANPDLYKRVSEALSVSYSNPTFKYDLKKLAGN